MVVHCLGDPDKPEHSFRLVLDYVTDKVLDQEELGGEPYLSPDSRFLVTVKDDGNTVSVHRLGDDGEWESHCCVWVHISGKN